MAKTAKAELTPKQREVLDRLHKEQDVAQIAKAMKISVNGVYQHKRRIEEAGYDIDGLGSRRNGSKATPRSKPQLVEAPPVAKEITVEEHVGAELARTAERMAEIDTQIQALGEEHATLEAQNARLSSAQQALLTA